ncbi:hypothetical protein CgunFtcFv8_006683 [Champsocephalus gunnari]|uniref:Uncharacterized protein n=1 Tax=Champsocephalus gunnari TaxID=52237 RepID=A0AAN8BYV9_CHAGU|nr:hypothetical protein CgunFtcFv8_006683 [Champsocephalus gunnari]
MNVSHHKGDFSRRRRTETCYPVSEGSRQMRQGVCEPSFVEDMPPSSDEGASKGTKNGISHPAPGVTGQRRDG